MSNLIKMLRSDAYNIHFCIDAILNKLGDFNHMTCEFKIGTMIPTRSTLTVHFLYTPEPYTRKTFTTTHTSLKSFVFETNKLKELVNAIDKKSVFESEKMENYLKLIHGKNWKFVARLLYDLRIACGRDIRTQHWIKIKRNSIV